MSMALLALALAARAEKSPLEHDFPDGYWDKEIMNYGRMGETYNVSLAVTDAADARSGVESLLKANGGKLRSFNDMTSHFQGMGDGTAARARPAYSVSYQLPEAKAVVAAKKLIGLGRLTQYSVNTPFGASQQKDAEERIARLEKEKKDNAQQLKAMPVSRALLDSKLKRLRAALDAAKTGHGQATIMVQILNELPEEERGKSVTP